MNSNERSNFFQRIACTAKKASCYYSVAVLVSQAFTLITRLITNNVLGPAMVGILAYIDMGRVYSMYLTAPFRSIVDMEVPILRGKGDDYNEQMLVSQSLILSTMGNIIISVVACLIATTSRDDILQTSLYIFAGANIFYQLFSFYQIVIRNYLKFKLLSLLIVCYSVGSNVLCIYAAIRWGIIGYLAAQGVFTVTLVVWIFKLKLFKVYWSLDRGTLEIIVKKGGWIGAGGVLYGLYIEMDRMLVVSSFSHEMVGYYTLVFLIVTNLLVLVNALNATFIPVLLKKYGGGTNRRTIGELCVVNMIQRTYGFVFIIVITYLLLPWLISVILPAFLPGIGLAQDCLIRILPLSIVPLCSAVFSATNNNKVIFIQSLGGLVLTGLVIWGVLQYVNDLAVVNWGMNISLILFGICAFIMFSKVTELKKQQTYRFLAFFNAMLFVTVWGCLIVEEIIVLLTKQGASDVILRFIFAFLFAVCYLFFWHFTVSSVKTWVPRLSEKI